MRDGGLSPRPLLVLSAHALCEVGATRLGAWFALPNLSVSLSGAAVSRGRVHRPHGPCAKARHATVSVCFRTGRPLKAWHIPAHPPPWGHGSAQSRDLTPGIFPRQSPKAKFLKTNRGKGAPALCLGTLGSPRPSSCAVPPSGGTVLRPVRE